MADYHFNVEDVHDERRTDVTKPGESRTETRKAIGVIRSHVRSKRLQNGRLNCLTVERHNSSSGHADDDEMCATQKSTA